MLNQERSLSLLRPEVLQLPLKPLPLQACQRELCTVTLCGPHHSRCRVYVTYTNQNMHWVQKPHI